MDDPIKFILLRHQLIRVRNIDTMPRKVPTGIENLTGDNVATEEMLWLIGLRSALGMALDCLRGKRYTSWGLTYAELAQSVLDEVLKKRGPEITKYFGNEEYNIVTITYPNKPESTSLLSDNIEDTFLEENDE